MIVSSDEDAEFVIDSNEDAECVMNSDETPNSSDSSAGRVAAAELSEERIGNAVMYSWVSFAGI